LYLTHEGKWHQQDDVVYPFYCYSCNGYRQYIPVKTVWTFDLDKDTLRCDKERYHMQVSLEHARRTPLAMSDFEPYALPAYPDTSCNIFSEASWSPQRQGLDQSLLQRRKALVFRVLSDFTLQWKHVLRGPYNNSTFRRLAYAVVRIITLDFTVVEFTTPRQSIGGPLVKPQDLPKWNPWGGDIVRHGGVSIVMCQHTPHAICLIRANFRKWVLSNQNSNSIRMSDAAKTYLIFSMQEIILYQISSELEKHSKVEPLFTNTFTLSTEAIVILLAATQQHAPKLSIQDVPVELQDMILDKCAAGPLQHAKLGCNLNIGSPFTWKWNDRDIEREQCIRNRSDGTPVESQIWFDNCFSGLAYK
jgi:hypothetical protein